MIDDQTALSRLLDEGAINRTIARFADAATLGDYDAFRVIWADDAEWTIGDPPGVHATGVDDIVANLRRLRADREFFIQLAVLSVIEIDGDVAPARCLGHEAARGPGETCYRNHYVVFDRLKRAPDGWVFTSRAFQYLWLDTSPSGGDGFSCS